MQLYIMWKVSIQIKRIYEDIFILLRIPNFKN